MSLTCQRLFWHYSQCAFRCKECGPPPLRSLPLADSGDEALMSLLCLFFANACNRLTEEKIIGVSSASTWRRRSAPAKFTVTWDDVRAASVHSHGSSCLWLCLSFSFPVFHLHWDFSIWKGETVPLNTFLLSLYLVEGCDMFPEWLCSHIKM